MSGLPEGILDISAFAKRLGVEPTSISRYLTGGLVPPADGYIGRSPWWHLETVETWIANRPGRTGRPRKAAEVS